MIAQSSTHRIHVDVIELLVNELVTPNINSGKILLPDSMSLT
jgi:hypothetical protein